MNTPDDIQAVASETVARPPAVKPLTKSQIRATATADGLALKAKWKALLAEAKITWAKVPTEDLARVDGNFHKLAGLVQLRYQLSREESDQQVRDFFGKHAEVA